MKSILHKAATRGHVDHGWLKSRHTFSFAGYNDPARVHFGMLRVLNDDTVAGGMGFGKHPHNDMEIISIPLQGDLQHSDDMGNTTIIKQGDVQIMSAGSGIAHSEKNAHGHDPVKFLQIWVFPDQKGIPPRYDQQSFSDDQKQNKLVTVVSPDGEGVHIHQRAWFSLGKFDKGVSVDYAINEKGNGVYAFLLDGNVTINDLALNKRDGLGIWETDTLKITADTDAYILLMDVPMN